MVVLSACQREEAAPVPWLSVPPSTPAGLATIDFGVDPGLGSTMSLRVSQGDTVVLEHSETLGLSQGHVAFQPDVGAYTATLEVTRQGEVVASTSADFRVFPTLTVNRRLPRMCHALAALNDEASAFDCDGTVIDADGGVLSFSGFECESRVVRTSSSTVRWRGCGGGLSAETPERGPDAAAAARTDQQIRTRPIPLRQRYVDVVERWLVQRPVLRIARDAHYGDHALVVPQRLPNDVRRAEHAPRERLVEDGDVRAAGAVGVGERAPRDERYA